MEERNLAYCIHWVHDTEVAYHIKQYTAYQRIGMPRWNPHAWDKRLGGRLAPTCSYCRPNPNLGFVTCFLNNSCAHGVVKLVMFILDKIISKWTLHAIVMNKWYMKSSEHFNALQSMISEVHAFLWSSFVCGFSRKLKRLLLFTIMFFALHLCALCGISVSLLN